MVALSSNFKGKIVDNNAYIQTLDGVDIIDISNPSAPIELSQYHLDRIYQNIPTRSFDFDLSGNYAYITKILGLEIVNISSPITPIKVGYYPLPGTATHITISNSFAYLSLENMGLRIINITNPTSPFGGGFLQSTKYFH